MKDTNLSTMFLPVLALFALVFPFALQVPNNQADNASQRLTPPTTSTPTPEAKPPNTAAALVCEFAAPDQQRCKGFWEGTKQKVTKMDNFERNVAQVETLLATIPDPQASSFDYAFDRNLEAIQRALEATGYTIDRYYLPWLKSRQEGEEPKKKEADSLALLRSAHEPGVILFRKNEGSRTQLLALFLIGETPTSGVQKTALTNALEQAKQLHSKPSTEQAKQLRPQVSTIRLLGPSFTGSATSLSLTLRSWLENKDNAGWHINIISGSATAIDIMDFRLRSAPTKELNRISFAATVTHSSAELAAFIKEYLKPGSQVKIALLLEANTAYGRNMAGKQKNLLELPFPLHISELRTAAEKTNAEEAKKNAVTNPAERKNVPLGMGQAKESSEVPPLTSKVEIASRELVLSNVLTTIKREAITHLGLAASNVQDRIFLVREIRQHAPNVVIFMLNSDLLHLHPEAQADFHGILMVTPYSLFNPNQRWIYPFSGMTRRLQFPAHGTQGIYNATLALLNHPELMLEYGNPFDSELVVSGVRRPPLWLSVVGRDRVWPIKTLAVEESLPYLFCPGIAHKTSLPKYASFTNAIESGVAANPTPQDAGEVIASLPDMISGSLSSKIPLIGLLFLNLICCVPSGVLLLELVRTKLRRNHIPVAHRIASWRVFRAIDRSPLARIFSDPVLPDPRLKFKRRCYLLVCSLILLGLALMVAWVYLMPIIASLRLAARLPDADLGLGIVWRVLWEGMTQYLLGSFLAVSLLLLTLLAALWMIASILNWLGDWLNDKFPKPLKKRPARTKNAASAGRVKRGFGKLKNRFEQVRVEKRPFALWRMIAFLDRSGGWLREKFFHPLKTKIDAARVEQQALPLWLGWLIFLVLLLFKARLAASAGLLTAATFVYHDVLWTAPVKLRELIEARQPQEDIFLFLRTTDLTSGVSPLLPLLFVGLAAFLAVFSSLRRLTLAEQACCEYNEVKEKPSPFLNFEGAQQPSFSGLQRLEMEVKEFLWCSFWKLNGGWLAILVLGGICASLFLSNRASLTLEGGRFDVTFCLAFSITVICLAIAFLRFIWLWWAVRRLLRRLSWHPLFADDAKEARAFFESLPKIKLTLPKSAYASTTFSLGQAQTLVNPQRQDISDRVEQAHWRLRVGHRAEYKGHWRISLRRLVKTQYLLAQLSNQVAQALEPHWNSAVNLSAPVSEEERWIRQGKLFLASRVTSFLHLVLAQLKNLATLVTTGLLLILLAVSSYPFQPREWLMLFGWITVLTVVAVTLVIFVQMGRDKVISLLSGTTPGQLDWNWEFTLKVLLHGLLPILALLGAQFPNAIGRLISLLGALQGGHH